MTRREETHIALLRGINVGGKNKLPMRDLAAIFTNLGCSAVTTYIQSGNVVFRATSELATKVPALVEGQIKKRFGYQTPVITRTGAELAAVVRANPFLDPGGDTERLMVMFLAARPDVRSIAALDGNRSPPDEFAVLGREIFLRCPNGYGPSKLSNAYFDSKLATTSTGRNWRTVLKLIELSSGAQQGGAYE